MDRHPAGLMVDAPKPMAWRELSTVRNVGQPWSDNLLQQAGTTKGSQVTLEALAKPAEFGAGNRIRTGDPQLGNVSGETRTFKNPNETEARWAGSLTQNPVRLGRPCPDLARK
jgi:hypothetical protein